MARGYSRQPCRGLPFETERDAAFGMEALKLAVSASMIDQVDGFAVYVCDFGHWHVRESFFG